MSIIKECPYCRGNRIDCEYCDESGLMDLNEIDRVEKDLERSYNNDPDDYFEEEE